MRRRAAPLVTFVSNGTFPACWHNFTADALRTGALRRRPVAHARRRRSTTTTASHPRPYHHWLSASARYARPPSSPRAASSVKLGDPFNPPPRWTHPRQDSSKCTLINLNPQDDGRPLTNAHVANEPRHAPLQVKQSLVAKVTSKLPKIRLPGSLPEDNRIITLVASHGGLVGLTAMVNACCRDVGSARSRDILAGAVRAGLLQKIDPP